MLNCYNEKLKYARELVNLTGRQFTVYEDSSGDFIDFPPSSEFLPCQPDVSDSVYYVLDEDAAEALATHGRDLSDIAIIRRTGAGRDGVMVSRLSWAVNQDKTIYISSYEEGNGCRRKDALFEAVLANNRPFRLSLACRGAS